MVRDHRRLRAFHEADELVLETYRLTATFPDHERFGLQSQLRRAAVSVAANIVEGSARQSARDYCRFLEVARAASCECAYLVDVSVRLRYLPNAALKLTRRYDHLSAALLAAASRIRALDAATQ
jgi:four helix bundle protein